MSSWADLTRDGPFRRYWLAVLLTVGAGAVARMALVLIAYRLTGSAWWAALVVAAEGLPYLVLGPIGGGVADRYDRRWLVVGTSITTAITLASLLLVVMLGRVHIGYVIGTAAVARSALAIGDTAHLGALPTLAGGSRLGVAQAAVYGSSTVVDATGPLLAGLAVLTMPVSWVLVGCAGAHIAAAGLIARVDRPLSPPPGEREHTSIVRGIGAAVAWLARHRELRAQTVVGMVQMAGQGLVLSQVVPMAHVLGAGDWSPALLTGAWAAGGMVVAAWLPQLAGEGAESRVTARAGPLAVVAACAAACAGAWWWAMVAIAAWGAGWAMTVQTGIIRRSRVTPPGMMSRVSATGRTLATGVGYPLGALIGGWVGAESGPRGALLTGAALLAVCTTLTWRPLTVRAAK
jgi:MFS family permease